MSHFLLNDDFVKKVPALRMPARYPDGDHLVIEVFPNWGKLWLNETTEGSIILGEFPKIKINEARDLNKSLINLVKRKILKESTLIEMQREYSILTDRFGSGEYLYKYSQKMEKLSVKKQTSDMKRMISVV